METAMIPGHDNGNGLTVDNKFVTQIFLSHKHSDAAEVRKVTRALNNFGRERVNVFASSSSIPPSATWRDDVENAVQRADIVILLFTDPELDWTWCLYECGFFEGYHNKQRKARRLYVIHDAGVHAPNVLEPVQWTAASRDDREGVKRLVRSLIGDIESQVSDEEPQPQSESERRKMLAAQSRKRRALENAFIDAVCMDPAGRRFEREITIQVRERSLKEVSGATVPDDSLVRCNEEGGKLVELGEELKGRAWSEFFDLLDNKSDNTKEWVGSLADLMWRIGIQRRCPNSTGLPIFRSTVNNTVQSYRPTVRSYKKRRDLLTFSITFADLPPEMSGKPPAQMNTLIQGLSLSRKFRWGVLIPLQEKLKKIPLLDRNAPKKNVAEYRGKLKRALEDFRSGIHTLTVEAANSDYDHDAFVASFPNDQQEVLRYWTDKWGEIYEFLLTAAKDSDEGLSELQSLRGYVESSLYINANFMRVCAASYLEALNRYAPIDETLPTTTYNATVTVNKKPPAQPGG